MPAMKAILMVSAILAASMDLCLAAQFGSIALKAGETQNISLFGAGGYRRIRVCNNAESTANVSVTIQPRDPRVLQPRLCTEDTGYELDLKNLGTGPATITFYPVSQGGFGMMGD